MTALLRVAGTHNLGWGLLHYFKTLSLVRALTQQDSGSRYLGRNDLFMDSFSVVIAGEHKSRIGTIHSFETRDPLVASPCLNSTRFRLSLPRPE
jgi:hypothetical protein